MAINGIKTAHEAKVVAEELTRIAENGGMVLFMIAMSEPGKREATAVAAMMLKGFLEFSTDLKKAAEGLKDDDEVFATVDMDMKQVSGMGALEELFGGQPL